MRGCAQACRPAAGFSRAPQDGACEVDWSCLQAELQERRRIAHELHDTVLQIVQGLVLTLQAMADQLLASGSMRAQLHTALDRADPVLAEGRLRNLHLRSPSACLWELADELVTPDAAPCLKEWQSPQLPAESCAQIVAIAAEALRSALRHAGAHRITVELDCAGRELSLRVCDDGLGIQPGVCRDGLPGHFGLATMRERAAAIGATLQLRSSIGDGTEVALHLVLPDKT